jgi:hypothetical protein
MVGIFNPACELLPMDEGPLTVNVDFLRIEYMVLAKYQHMSILELILLVKQHILILCKNLLGVDVLIIVN